MSVLEPYLSSKCDSSGDLLERDHLVPGSLGFQSLTWVPRGRVSGTPTTPPLLGWAAAAHLGPNAGRPRGLGWKHLATERLWLLCVGNVQRFSIQDMLSVRKPASLRMGRGHEGWWWQGERSSVGMRNIFLT